MKPTYFWYHFFGDASTKGVGCAPKYRGFDMLNIHTHAGHIGKQHTKEDLKSTHQHNKKPTFWPKCVPQTKFHSNPFNSFKGLMRESDNEGISKATKRLLPGPLISRARTKGPSRSISTKPQHSNPWSTVSTPQPPLNRVSHV